MPGHVNSFDQAIVYVLKNEGGYTYNVHDGGGPTNHGITESDYALFKGHPVTPDEVKNMPIEDAKAIYKAKFWNTRMAQLNPKVATVIMDWGVLHGTQNSRQLAQTTANLLGANPTIFVDGILTEECVQAINQIDPDKFIEKYSEEVKNFLDARVRLHPSQRVFLVGWNARADRMKTLIVKE
jgi:lysozyme family protein